MILLDPQSPNIPDSNMLDLGMVAGIQSLQYEAASRNVQELVHAVQKAYKDYDSQLIDDNCITRQKCMESTMRVGSGNNYALPNMKKRHNRQVGTPVRDVTCDESFYIIAINIAKELST